MVIEQELEEEVDVSEKELGEGERRGKVRGKMGLSSS